MRKLMRMAMASGCGCLLLAGCSPQQDQPSVAAGVAPAASGSVLELTDATFGPQTAQGVVLVDFWAPWCGPCRMQGPLVETVAGRLGKTAKVAKVNVDQASQTAQKFGVQSIPTLIVLKDG